MYNSLYQVTFRDGSIKQNLSYQECEEIKQDGNWLYIDTMEGIKISEMRKKLRNGERLTSY